MLFLIVGIFIIIRWVKDGQPAFKIIKSNQQLWYIICNIYFSIFVADGVMGSFWKAILSSWAT